MAHNPSFMGWLNKQHPALFEMFNREGVFIEKVNNQFVLHVIIIDEEIPLDRLNKLQDAWNDYILLENLGAEAHPLIVTQNKFWDFYYRLNRYQFCQESRLNNVRGLGGSRLALITYIWKII